jgi:hypothetical protein
VRGLGQNSLYLLDKNEKISNETTMTEHKKHSIIPNSMRVQLKDSENRILKIENVLCHLNIFSNSSNYYHTYSFIPTDSTGKVILIKEEIITNTKLKHCYDENLALDKSPVKFEFFIMPKETLKYLIPNLRGYLNVKPESIKEDLRRRGFSESQIEREIPKVLKKQKEDERLYKILIKNRNADLEYSEKNSKITGYWNDEKDCEYEIKIKTEENKA